MTDTTAVPAPSLLSSWRTTLGGLLAGVPLICASFAGLLDNDPTTTFSFALFASGCGLVYKGFVSRDNAVTSEAAGLKPDAAK